MNQRIEIQDNNDLDETLKDVEDIAEKGVLRAAIKQQTEAKRDMRGHTKYHLYDVAEGIMVGKLKKDKAQAQTKVHPFGSGEHKNLARIFVAGTVMRSGVSKNGKPYTKGYISPTDSISKTENQAMTELDDFLRRHITHR